MAQLELIQTSRFNHMQAPVADTQPDANLQTQTQTQAADSEECDSYTAHRLARFPKSSTYLFEI